jgi:hypothetical protein
MRTNAIRYRGRLAVSLFEGEELRGCDGLGARHGNVLLNQVATEIIWMSAVAPTAARKWTSPAVRVGAITGSQDHNTRV